MSRSTQYLVYFSEQTVFAVTRPGLCPHTCLYPVSGGLTSKIRHDHSLRYAMITAACCALLTWVPSPVSGMDFQPRT